MENPWADPLDGVSTAAVLREALAGAEGVKCAFVFGSLAAGGFRKESDADVMVIGSIAAIDVSARVSRLADSAVGREINYVLYTLEEFGTRLKARNHFVVRVLAGPKIFLVGDARALDELAAGGP